MKCKYLPLLLIAVPALCFGTNVPTPTTSGPKAESSATANSLAGSAAFSAATSSSQSESAATALSNANQSQTAQGGTAAATTTTSVDGNNASQSITYARQAPSVAQGSLYGSQCVSGGNAGGSNTGGSAFLGFQFTPYECHLARLAASWEDAGDHKTACEILRRSPAMKRLKRETGFEPPPCEDKVVVPVVTVPRETPPPVNVNVALPDMSGYALKTEVAESQKRQTERLTTK
jgi:hypothetical protein